MLLELYIIKTTRSIQVPSFHKTIDRLCPWVWSCSQRKKSDSILLNKNFFVWPSFGKLPLCPRGRRKKKIQVWGSLFKAQGSQIRATWCRGMWEYAGEQFSRCNHHPALPFLTQLEVFGKSICRVPASPSCGLLSPYGGHLPLIPRLSCHLRSHNSCPGSVPGATLNLLYMSTQAAVCDSTTDWPA